MSEHEDARLVLKALERTIELPNVENMGAFDVLFLLICELRAKLGEKEKGGG